MAIPPSGSDARISYGAAVTREVLSVYDNSPEHDSKPTRTSVAIPRTAPCEWPLHTPACQRSRPYFDLMIYPSEATKFHPGRVSEAHAGITDGRDIA
jgi:hypothetical protein